MKKITCAIVLGLLICANSDAFAHSRHYHSSSSSHSYLVGKDEIHQEHKFPNCQKHYLQKHTTVYFYSNGTRSSYTNNTILNTDGTIIQSECSSVKHLIYEDKHYFIVYKGKGYKILDDNGEELTLKKYSKMEEIVSDRLLVRYDKKYGIIDLDENVIVPLKYKSFDRVGKNLFITNLNGYYGMIDYSNNVLIKNEYDKIKPLYNTFLLKQYGLYGLADINGKIILEAQYDKIKKLGEYILVKKDKKYGVYDSVGNKITDIKYKDIRLERNVLEGKLNSGRWVEINPKI